VGGGWWWVRGGGGVGGGVGREGGGGGGWGGELCSNQSGEGVVEGSCVVIRAHCPFNGYVYRAAYTSTILP